MPRTSSQRRLTRPGTEQGVVQAGIPVSRARIRPLRVALHRQRDDVPGFARVLDGKLAAVAQWRQPPLDWRRHLGDACLELAAVPPELNHRVFMRNLRTERVGKSPKQLLTEFARVTGKRSKSTRIKQIY